MAENRKQPTYKRQRFLLDFIRQLPDSVSAIDLQKLIFLHIMEENSDLYEFVPYKYGSYSFQLAEDVEILRGDNFLSNDSLHIQAVGEYLPIATFSIAGERGHDLIRKAYRAYPYYTINSEIVSKLFDSNELEEFKREKSRYAKKEQMLFTIGYEGKSIEAFMNILIQNDIRVLCDVRKNSLSRKFCFSKSKLANIAENIGIKYIHIPELGIKSCERDSLETISDYQNLFMKYEKTLPNLKQYLNQIYQLLKSNVRIALMCYENKAEMCHRQVIRDYLTNNCGTKNLDL